MNSLHARIASRKRPGTIRACSGAMTTRCLAALPRYAPGLLRAMLHFGCRQGNGSNGAFGWEVGAPRCAGGAPLCAGRCTRRESLPPVATWRLPPEQPSDDGGRSLRGERRPLSSAVAILDDVALEIVVRDYSH